MLYFSKLSNSEPVKILIDYISEVRQVILKDQDFAFKCFCSLSTDSQFQISAVESKCCVCVCACALAHTHPPPHVLSEV